MAGLDRSFWWLLAGLGVAGLFLRAELAAGSPHPAGYWYDPYHDVVVRTYASGRFPQSTDCWQCYHPPLFPLLALPLYSAGVKCGGDSETGLRWMMAVPFACGCGCVAGGWRTLRDLGYDRREQLLGAALLVSFPCLALSTYGFEADILVAVIVIAFTRRLLKYHLAATPGVWDAILLGGLAGLAAATKYSGLLAGLVGVQVLGLKVLLGPERRWGVVHLGSLVLVAAAVGGGKYVDNWKRYGTPLFANGTANDGFAPGRGRLHWEQYEFHTLRLPEAAALHAPDAPAGKLTDQPVYASVPTTLHAQAWTDMSFFSNPTRHGIGEPLYPARGGPGWLVHAVLWLGLVVDVLAVAGVVLNAVRRDHLPLTLLVLNGTAAYLLWVLGQTEWALKTKYLLFLLPAGVAGVLTAVRRLPRWAGRLAVAAVLAQVLLCGLYLHLFAVGG